MARDIAILIIGIVLGVIAANQVLPDPTVKPGTIKAVYDKGYEDGMYYVAEYWAGQIKDCFYKKPFARTGILAIVDPDLTYEGGDYE